MGQRHDVDVGQQRGAQCLRNAGRRPGHAALFEPGEAVDADVRQLRNLLAATTSDSARMAVIDQAGLVGLHACTASTQELGEGRS
jgi:hypothetical protein